MVNIITGLDVIFLFLYQYTVKPLYSDLLYNSKIPYNVICICTNVPVYLEFDFITTELQLLTSNYLGTNSVVV